MSIRLITVAACCVLWPLLASAQLGCSAWNSKTFSEKAMVEDVARCIASGADLEARGKYGQSPLHWAAQQGKAASIKILLDAGADSNARDEFGSTPLHAAQSSAVVSTLLMPVRIKGTEQARRDAPVHKVGAQQRPIRHCGASDAGAELNARDKKRWTLLRAAAGMNASPEVIKTLIGAGSRPKHAQ